MAPFLSPSVVLSGLKERAESLLVQGDKLYVGTATGSVHVYTVGNNPSVEESQQAELVEVKKGLSRRAIEQLAYVQDINSLAVLSDATVTLYPLPTFSPPTPLPKSKTALSFALDTSVERDEEKAGSKNQGVPVIVTRLVIGCRRKVVIYCWRDGEPQEVQEATLPHSPRNLAFLNGETVCFGYAPDYALFNLKTLTVTEVSTPMASVTSSSSIGGMGRGALSGLGGYMTLGLGAKTVKPCVLRIKDREVLIAKDNNGIFLGVDGKPSRTTTIDWPAPPEEAAFVKPYIFSILPPGSVSTSQSEPRSTESSSNLSFIPTSVLEIRSSISLQPAQTLPVPFVIPPPTTATQVVRLLTASPSAKPPVFLVTTPADRTAATAEGSTIWKIDMKPWGEQVDELIEAEAYGNGLALLDTIDTAILPDKEERKRLVRALHAVSQFRSGHFSDAMNLFLELNVNPAKVVALYPESVAGRLSLPQDEWIPLFGGPRKISPSDSSSSHDSNEEATITADGSSIPAALDAAAQRPPSPHGSIRGIGMLSKRKDPEKPQDNLKRSVEELMRYLTDRRPKVKGALEALNITTLQAHEMPNLSAASIDDLYALPNIPLTSLSPEQLVRFAQIVDTALFKSYLLVRPGLLQSLCRSGNWCEISEVEEVLRSREIFTSEEEELPRHAVMDYLEMIDVTVCAQYLEFLVAEREEQSPDFHDRLAELYLRMTIQAKKKGDSESRKAAYTKLLEFVDTTTHYRPDRLFGLLPSDGMHYLKLFIACVLIVALQDLFEAKAVLLGRLGRHDNALEIYVYRLQDFLKAEEYVALSFFWLLLACSCDVAYVTNPEPATASSGPDLPT
ncbi:hypothetical protein EUX98_g6176 [Antrodiella citrinella]|uniref:CNH domain-containing protein n=1 Tax=Antrodiella citrinella TaxID=2447956 RepID=A0A4S4MX71_9APHY|nr:hypothetical protein EUX98_g6176 [Antrodiella citrinella]